MNTTKKYIDEHQHVFSLPRKSETSLRPRKLIGWSIFRLLKSHFFSVLSCIFHYTREVCKSWSFLRITSSLKGSAVGKRVLLIGNGPSQGYLTIQKLKKFILSGGETICVNYWQENKLLNEHIPNWLVLSDPETFSERFLEAESLIKYLKINSSIKVVAPSSWVGAIKKLNLKNECYFFIDVELSVWKNINPTYPRGYLSMTLYKGMAWAVHLGYKEIGVIGMDNTYPRNIYNDDNNKICNLELHAGIDDYIVDQSSLYQNVASRLDDLARLFYHLEYFPFEKIVNLDRYSLTDRFRKVDFNFFFDAHN